MSVSVHTCVVPIVRGKEDVGVVQFTSVLQPLDYFLHQVIYRQ